MISAIHGLEEADYLLPGIFHLAHDIIGLIEAPVRKKDRQEAFSESKGISLWVLKSCMYVEILRASRRSVEDP